ncbi:hypothetical protein BDZ91DRAFT_49643 [Kalaharituber pfeilii]|nr:hypothetical protein BDZ91DRAFT_49643 [Kalaharituber pfeilii]
MAHTTGMRCDMFPSFFPVRPMLRAHMAIFSLIEMSQRLEVSICMQNTLKYYNRSRRWRRKGCKWWHEFYWHSPDQGLLLPLKAGFSKRIHIGNRHKMVYFLRARREHWQCIYDGHNGLHWRGSYNWYCFLNLSIYYSNSLKPLFSFCVRHIPPDLLGTAHK